MIEIKPDYDLNIMKMRQDIHDVIARVITEMRVVLNEVKPDVVLVHGNARSSATGPLVVFYQQIQVR